MIQTLGETLAGPFGWILYYGSEALTLAVVPAYFAYFDRAHDGHARARHPRLLA